MEDIVSAREQRFSAGSSSRRRKNYIFKDFFKSKKKFHCPYPVELSKNQKFFFAQIDWKTIQNINIHQHS